jgi:hypothetical protein
MIARVHFISRHPARQDLRHNGGVNVVALLYLDEPFPEHVLAELRSNKLINSAKPLVFDMEGARTASLTNGRALRMPEMC